MKKVKVDLNLDYYEKDNSVGWRINENDFTKEELSESWADICTEVYNHIREKLHLKKGTYIDVDADKDANGWRWARVY